MVTLKHNPSAAVGDAVVTGAGRCDGQASDSGIIEDDQARCSGHSGIDEQSHGLGRRPGDAFPSAIRARKCPEIGHCLAAKIARQGNPRAARNVRKEFVSVIIGVGAFIDHHGFDVAGQQIAVGPASDGGFRELRVNLVCHGFDPLC